MDTSLGESVLISTNSSLESFDSGNDTSFFKELECKLSIRPNFPSSWCGPSWDKVLCWPPSPPGKHALQPCIGELNGIQYDTSDNASRFCHANGTWSLYTDYAACRDISSTTALETGIEVTTTLYYVGYTMSLVALILAVSVFLYFKDLKCLRNTIHTNLMCTYILADSTWILTITLQITHSEMTSCLPLIVLLQYSSLTNFFWMFVEGLYLYTLVVEAFQRKTVKLRVYMLIGWGTPVIFLALWVIVKSFAPMEAKVVGDSLGRHCPWMAPHWSDWLYQGPTILVLVINLLFLIMVMWVLITKLRSANNVETQQYRKASKALLVLIPLLGVTYILVMAGPSEGSAAKYYEHVRAMLLSTQGLLVALFYCFLNSDVRSTMRHHWQRWEMQRSVRSRAGHLSMTVNSTSGAAAASAATASAAAASAAVAAAAAAALGATRNGGCKADRWKNKGKMDECNFCDDSSATCCTLGNAGDAGANVGNTNGNKNGLSARCANMPL